MIYSYKKKKIKNKILYHAERILVYAFMIIGILFVLNWSINIFSAATKFWIIDGQKIVIYPAHISEISRHEVVNAASSPAYKEICTSSAQCLIDKYFGNEARTAKAVMLAESGGDATRIGDLDKTFYKDGQKYGASYGLFQIRNLPSRHFANPEDLLNIETNIKVAYEIYQKAGNSFVPWSTFNNGQYLAFVN